MVTNKIALESNAPVADVAVDPAAGRPKTLGELHSAMEMRGKADGKGGAAYIEACFDVFHARVNGVGGNVSDPLSFTQSVYAKYAAERDKLNPPTKSPKDKGDPNKAQVSKMNTFARVAERPFVNHHYVGLYKAWVDTANVAPASRAERWARINREHCGDKVKACLTLEEVAALFESETKVKTFVERLERLHKEAKAIAKEFGERPMTDALRGIELSKVRWQEANATQDRIRLEAANAGIQE